MFDEFKLEFLEVGRRASAFDMAAPARRCLSCTITRARMKPGTGSRRFWPLIIRLSVVTCAVSAGHQTG
jgi:hypothetical protein